MSVHPTAKNNSPGLPILIAFGSNIDPLPNLLHGLHRLHQTIGLHAVSQVYRTAALPDPNTPERAESDPDYLNGAVWMQGSMDPHALRDLLRDIEQELCRVRSQHRYAPRTLDLDIALMGEQLIHTDLLTIPDPDIIHRPFLAIPLAELAPNTLHPIEKIPLLQIAARFEIQRTGMVRDDHATALLQAIPQ